MKRALLIAGGTVGGLGAVLSITPPHFGTDNGVVGGISTTTTSATTAATTVASTPTPAATKAASTATKKATATATKKATAAATKAAATKAATTTTTNPKASINGTFAGSTARTQFGNVQVEITVVNGKITSARALQSPNRDYRSQQISSQAVPYLIQETLAAQSANIQGVGGASYTSQGWYDSLVSALAKAGM